jgi:hypothetical protein
MKKIRLEENSLCVLKDYQTKINYYEHMIIKKRNFCKKSQ